MADTRISAVDLLRLAAIASVSPEGSPDEILAILQRSGPVTEPNADPGESGEWAPTAEPYTESVIVGPSGTASTAGSASDKLAKPE